MKPGALATSVAPTVGPAVVTLAGLDIPVLALVLSMLALILARLIAPPPLEKMTRAQEWMLTALLLIVLFLAVTGELPLIGTGEPLSVGMGVVWGIGLGFSGMLVVGLIRDRVIAMIKVALGAGSEKG